METHVILCACHSDEHQLIYRYDPEDKEIYTSVYLHQYRGFWKRVWVGIRYMFGYQSKYGAWDSIHMGRDQIKILHDLTKRALEDQDKN